MGVVSSFSNVQIVLICTGIFWSCNTTNIICMVFKLLNTSFLHKRWPTVLIFNLLVSKGFTLSTELMTDEGYNILYNNGIVLAIDS